jgi:hypothetical protein
MVIAQTDSLLGAVYAVYILFSVVYAIQVFFVYFVIWTRKDWLSETRIASTIAVTIGIWIPPVTYVLYSIVDVVSRRAVRGGVKALWVVVIVLLPGIGVLAYLIWALQAANRPDERMTVDRRRSCVPSTETRDRDGAMTSDDLDYLQKLATSTARA